MQHWPHAHPPKPKCSAGNSTLATAHLQHRRLHSTHAPYADPAAAPRTSLEASICSKRTAEAVSHPFMPQVQPSAPPPTNHAELCALARMLRLPAQQGTPWYWCRCMPCGCATGGSLRDQGPRQSGAHVAAQERALMPLHVGCIQLLHIHRCQRVEQLRLGQACRGGEAPRASLGNAPRPCCAPQQCARPQRTIRPLPVHLLAQHTICDLSQRHTAAGTSCACAAGWPRLQSVRLAGGGGSPID